MYWFNVNIPMSEGKIKEITFKQKNLFPIPAMTFSPNKASAPANEAAVKDFVISQTVRKLNGVRKAPRSVQATRIPK